MIEQESKDIAGTAAVLDHGCFVKLVRDLMMLKGKNDSLECAEQLVKLFRKRSLSMLNLIVYNPTGNFEPSDPETVKAFKNFLETHGVFVTQRYEFGQDIKAACGQLASRK